MSYVKALESLRQRIQSTDPVAEAREAVNPPRPRGFAPAARTPQAAPSTPQYAPLDFTRNTMREIQQAMQRFKENMAKIQANSKQANSSRRNTGFMATFSESLQDRAQSSTAPAEPLPPLFNEGGSPRATRASVGPAGGPASSTLTGEMAAVAQSIKDIESGGGNYQARGPVVETGRYAGQRAMGAYQVMPGNLPEWSRLALGRVVSEEEFMSSPEIQDAIFADQMTRSFDRYGSWDDAASVWFTGRPVSQSQSASDGYTSAPEYIRRFREGYTKYNDGNV